MQTVPCFDPKGNLQWERWGHYGGHVLHHAIPPDGPGLREVTYGSQKLVVENTCFYAGNRARIDDERDVKRGLCKYPGSWRDYLEKLGIVGRDTSKHPWGE